MRPTARIAAAVFIGVIAAQIISAAFLYQANLDLAARTKLIADAGYLAAPNSRILPFLYDWRTAVFGGFFFSLSAGAGISFLAAFAGVLHVMLFKRKRFSQVIFTLLFATSLITINKGGFDWFPTLMIAVVAPVVFLIAAGGKNPNASAKGGAAFWLPIMLIASLGWTAVDNNFWLNVRDFVLWTNPAGERLVDFYYRYTLYPAEMFKSLDQKTLKIARLTGFEENKIENEVKKILTSHGYFTVWGSFPVDLEIEHRNQELFFRRDGRLYYRVSLEGFLSDHGIHLEFYSQMTDHLVLWRKIVRICLFSLAPLALYVMLFGFIGGVLSVVIGTRPASIAAAIVCLIVGAWTPVAVLRALPTADPDRPAIERLSDPNWAVRAAALKDMDIFRTDITQIANYESLLTSTRITERYWAVRALGWSNNKEAEKKLFQAISDPNINVACMAYLALSRRGDASAVPTIKSGLRDSADWYVQTYAYRALRELEWRQE